MTLFTFGYEGVSVEDFISRLLASGVQQVLDVRELPLSRKRGFSKKAFASALCDAGIGYRHLSTFGCPRPVRTRYKADHDWKAYVTSYSNYLQTQENALNELAKTAKEVSCCLVCFEEDFRRCHRSLVARASREAGGPKVCHLTATGAVADENVLLAA